MNSGYCYIYENNKVRSKQILVISINPSQLFFVIGQANCQPKSGNDNKVGRKNQLSFCYLGCFVIYKVKTRLFSTVFIPYFTNKTTLVAGSYIYIFPNLIT